MPSQPPAAAPAGAPGAAVTRVLFIHPAFPNQFTAIAEALNARPDFECSGLVSQEIWPAARQGNGLSYYGFRPDGQVTPQTYPQLTAFETALRNARGIAGTLLATPEAHRYDVVVGHAAFGGSLLVRPLLDCAMVAYSELPGYQAVAARPDFPLTVDQALAGHSLEALHYASVLHADLCIVPSEHVRALYPPELQSKIRVQIEGFDAERVPESGPAARQALGWPVEAPVVGFFSRTLEAVRGFDVFLQVAGRLHAADPRIQFVVIGDEKTLYGNETLYLQGQSFKQYALDQAGVPADLFRWYPLMPYEAFRRHVACLDLVILPVLEGAANWSLFEAMALGRPILAANRCYVPEAIRDGLDGVLLDPFDVAGFAAHALALLREPRRARLLGRSARERVRRSFSVGQAAAGYRRIIQEAVAIHRAGRMGRPVRSDDAAAG